MSEAVSQYYEAFQKNRNKAGTMEVPERLQFIRDQVGRDKDVIELGCRFGALIEHFLDGNRVVGADVDRHALEDRQAGIASADAVKPEHGPSTSCRDRPR